VDNDVVRAGYDEGADAYVSSRSKTPDPRIEEIARQLRPGSRVLDLGCGAGVPTSKFLVECGFEVIGMDVSPRQIERARELVPTATFVVRDMRELAAGELAVDAVVALYSVFHVPREEHARIYRVLRSLLLVGGLFLLIGGGDDWEGTENDFHGVPMFWSQHDAATTHELVEAAGFTVLSDSREEIDGEAHQVIVAEAS
jgi:cyclopropane fatty-acyl-phospholipid synthase-like methyltransferase